MKKILIAALIGGLIHFGLGALSWMLLPVHEGSFKYAPDQEELLSILEQTLPEEGYYMLPQAPPGSTQDQHHEAHQQAIGKPWAIINYSGELRDDMGSNMAKGLTLSFLACLIMALVLHRFQAQSPGIWSNFVLCMAFPLFLMLQSQLVSAVWWYMPWHYLKGEITDLALTWVPASLFLAWYLKK